VLRNKLAQTQFKCSSVRLNKTHHQRKQVLFLRTVNRQDHSFSEATIVGWHGFCCRRLPDQGFTQLQRGVFRRERCFVVTDGFGSPCFISRLDCNPALFAKQASKENKSCDSIVNCLPPQPGAQMESKSRLAYVSDKPRHYPGKATWLSLLLPGLGQLYVGRRAGGLVRLITAAGIICAILLATAGPAAFRSWISVLILELAYLSLWVASVVDASGPTTKSSHWPPAGENTWFIAMMLIMSGPVALPMLWHSGQFSQRWKILWTLIVVAGLVLGVLIVMLLGPQLESPSSEILYLTPFR